MSGWKSVYVVYGCACCIVWGVVVWVCCVGEVLRHLCRVLCVCDKEVVSLLNHSWA